MKELEQTYIKTGKVRFVFRDFPTPNHKSAVRAAHAAHCAADQGRYWDMHDALYAHQDRLGGDHDADFATLRDLAGSIGLDTTTFMTCMESRKYLDRITNDVVAGEAKGVHATPAYLLDDQLLLGLYPIGTWKKLIDQELAK